MDLTIQGGFFSPCDLERTLYYIIMYLIKIVIFVLLYYSIVAD